MLILGIDPGLANSGYGIVKAEGQSLSLIEHGVITTETSQAFPDRLVTIHDGFQKLIERYSPEACSVESIFFAKNAKSAFQVGHARAVCILTAALKGVPVFEYTPLEIKKAVVGVGRAEKQQVQYMVKMILNLKETPQPDHAADAIAAAVCHANSMKFGRATGRDHKVYGR